MGSIPGWRTKIPHATWCYQNKIKIRIKKKRKKAGVAILISDKIGFTIKTVTRDKKGHYIMIKGSIQEYTTIVNIYAPNIGAPKYIRQMLTDIKGEIDNNTM